MKTRDLVVFSTALVVTAIAMPAAAQSSAFDPGFYIGGGFGQSHVSGGNNSVVIGGVTYTASGFDDNKTTGQVNAGYQFTEMSGLEVQYSDFGSAAVRSRDPTVSARGRPA
ncbi:MAG TPA: outer membrane beta-barrel protein [Burkholderiales bacterium]|nr:outer membrane beta-barrel protein [Burkholderiales bacterium]